MTRQFRFYVAGKADGGENKVRRVADALVERGWQWAFDWTSRTVAKPYLEHSEENRQLAEEMQRAAASSDLVVFVPSPDVFGALIEVGVAIEAGATVVVFSEARDSIFWCLPNVHQVTDIEELNNVADSVKARG